LKRPKSHTENITKKLKGKDTLEDATMVGCCAMLTPMGDLFTFKTKLGIKYTFERKWEN